MPVVGRAIAELQRAGKAPGQGSVAVATGESGRADPGRALDVPVAVVVDLDAGQQSVAIVVETVAELAQRPQNIEALQSAGKFLDYFLWSESSALYFELTVI